MSTIQDTDLTIVERPALATGANTLTLDMEGTGTTFTDTSPSPVAITAFGGATHGVPAGGAHSGTSALYLPNTINTYLRTASAAKFATGTASFEASAWVYILGYNNKAPVLDTRVTAGTGGWVLYMNGAGYLVIAVSVTGGGGEQYAVGKVPLNTWTKVSLKRVGNSWASYINDVLNYSLYSTTSITNTTVTIGAFADGTNASNPIYAFNGYIDDVSINGLTVSAGANYNVTRGRMKDIVLTSQPSPFDWLMPCRGTTNYKASWAQVKSGSSTGTDLYAIDRAGTNYKCTFTDLDLYASVTYTIDTNTVTPGNNFIGIDVTNASATKVVTVYWGDGTSNSYSANVNDTGHSYATAGVYTVKIVWSTVSGGTAAVFQNSIGAVQFYDLFQNTVSVGPIKGSLPYNIYSNQFIRCRSDITYDPVFMEYARPASCDLMWRYGKMTSFPAGWNFDFTSGFTSAWEFCTSLTSFPMISIPGATSLVATWKECPGLTSFPLIDTSKITNFGSGTNQGTWYNCSGLTSFPLIDTSSATAMGETWRNCRNLTSFPLINTAKVSFFYQTWYECQKLTSFPLIDTGSATDMRQTWNNCSLLASMPLINTANVTSMSFTWGACSSLGSFPLINTASVTNMAGAWYQCGGLTSFPLLNTGNVTNFNQTWINCQSLTSFPAIDTSKGIDFSNTWGANFSRSSFPVLNFSAAVTFAGTWGRNDACVTFPGVVSGVGPVTGFPATVTSFNSAWKSCQNMTTFPANQFNLCTNAGINYVDAFLNCRLSAQSIENILTSWVTSGVTGRTSSFTNPNFGSNAGFSTWTAAGVTAYNTLITRGWTITYNP